MLTSREQEFKNELIEALHSLLAEYGVVPERREAFPQQMTTPMVANRKGVTTKTVTINWRKWGLKKIGKGKNGFIFCGASVCRQIERENQEK